MPPHSTTPPNHGKCTQCHTKPIKYKDKALCTACYHRQRRAAIQDGTHKPRPKKMHTPPTRHPSSPSAGSPLHKTTEGVAWSTDSDEGFGGLPGYYESDVLGVTRQALDGVAGPPWKVQVALVLAAEIDRARSQAEAITPASLVKEYRAVMADLLGDGVKVEEGGSHGDPLAAIFDEIRSAQGMG